MMHSKYLMCKETEATVNASHVLPLGYILVTDMFSRGNEGVIFEKPRNSLYKASCGSEDFSKSHKDSYIYVDERHIRLSAAWENVLPRSQLQSSDQSSQKTLN